MFYGWMGVHKMKYLSTKWVDYGEEPMKYQQLGPHFFSVGGWLEDSWGWWDGWVGGGVGVSGVGWGGSVCGDGVGDGVFGGW